MGRFIVQLWCTYGQFYLVAMAYLWAGLSCSYGVRMGRFIVQLWRTYGQVYRVAMAYLWAGSPESACGILAGSINLSESQRGTLNNATRLGKSHPTSSPNSPVSQIVTWCFQPNQPQRIISRLITNVSLFHIVILVTIHKTTKFVSTTTLCQ